MLPPRAVDCRFSLTTPAILDKGYPFPPEAFEVQGMVDLSISNMNLHQLPQHVALLSTKLSLIHIWATSIFFFWGWTDELAGPSPYYDDLEKNQNETATSFSVPLTPEYSQTLMDPSEANKNVILEAVRCNPTIEGLFYPHVMEVYFSAISIPPSLVGPV
ncbi:hypothetical protein P3T76_004112 [Phytophthora citrophthora]|uniref:Uncharacterized protein n=1 Tax=Phytophthora citrophthora TaxID=4793 RepID=A0AAD9GSV5_9STRA|nr:hypothetical protein P3T76_004112 [Phytophthora citrophthora]